MIKMPSEDPPKTVREVGIVLSFMAKDIKSLTDTVSKFPDGFATKDALAGVDSRVTKLESRNGIKNTLLWVGLVASAIINIVVIYQLFSGK